MKKWKITVIVLAALVVICAVAGFLFHENYLVIQGNVYSRAVTELDLSGKPIEDIQVLTQLTALAQLDLTNTGLTVEEYEFLHAALPECQIHWLLPFQGRYLPLDLETLTLSQLREQDISLLSYLPALKSIDASQCRDYDALLALKSRFPALDVHYQLTLGNAILKEDADHLTSASIAHIQTALRYLPNLTSVDASGCTDFEALFALKEQYPQCTFSYQVPFCGTFWPDDTTQLAVKSTSAADLLRVLAYLPNVTQITITDPIPDPDAMLSLIEAYPNLDLSFSFPLLDQTVRNDATSLDLSGIELRGTTELEMFLPLFTQLEKVDMCGCGISNEEMAALNQRNPDTLFVWEVQMGHFKLRTDITYFMPYKYRYRVTDADADTLKYLTELICIDFGHMDITRTDYLAYMPKMQYLLMCDTPITDISYVAGMKDLKYVELFMTSVTDFSPLLECKNLVDLNICYTYPDDPMIFAQMTQLENLWFRGDLDSSIRQALREALPNTRMLFGPGSSTGRGWRRLPNYYAMRDLLGMPYMEEP